MAEGVRRAARTATHGHEPALGIRRGDLLHYGLRAPQGYGGDVVAAVVLEAAVARVHPQHGHADEGQVTHGLSPGGGGDGGQEGHGEGCEACEGDCLVHLNQRVVQALGDCEHDDQQLEVELLLLLGVSSVEQQVRHQDGGEDTCSDQGRKHDCEISRERAFKV